MNKRLGIFKVSAVVVLVVSAVLSCIRTVILQNNLDFEPYQTGTGKTTEYLYFINRNVETISFLAFAAAFGIAFVILAIIVGKKANSVIDSADDTTTIFICALNGFMHLSVGMYYIYDYFKSGDYTVTQLITFILMIFAACVFLAFAISRKIVKSKYSLLLRLVPFGYVAYRLITTFIKHNSKPLNSAVAINLLGLAVLMIFIIRTGKMSYGTGSMRLYLITGYLSIFLLILFAVPNLYISIYNYKYPDVDTCNLISAADISFALYCFVKVYGVTYVNKKDAADVSKTV